MKKRSTSLLLGAFAVTALLGACGDDKNSSGGAAPTGTAAGTGSTSPGTITSDADYCSKLKAYRIKRDEMGSIIMNSGDATATKNAFATEQSMLHDLDKNAPTEIAADVHTMTSALDTIIAIFDKYDWDTQALATAPENAEMTSTMDNADAAATRVDTYMTDVCGIPPDTTTGS